MSVLDDRFPSNQPVDGLELHSTRNPEITADAWEALVAGQAPDGGLFVPNASEMQAFETDFFAAGSESYHLSMAQTSALLLRQFIPSQGEAGISNQDLQMMMDAAHNFELPLEILDESTMIAWLSESRTGSFKDFSARAIAQLMERYCEREQTPKNIVVATSGDTGVAIADAFGHSNWVTVTVLYPKGKVSPVQEAQMIDAVKQYPNVQCLPVDGDFDRAQAFSKSMQFMRDLDTSQKDSVEALRNKMKDQLNVVLAEEVITNLSQQLQKLELASANSINIWRLLPQMTQYFVSYFKAVNSGEVLAGEEVVFAVPTGNVGHLMAGMYAQQLGLPVKKFVVGTNSNDLVTCALRDFQLKHNHLTQNDKGETQAVATESPSMDVADPSNLERLLILIRDLSDPTAKLDLEQLKKDIKAFQPGQEGISLTNYGVTVSMLAYMQRNFYAHSTSDEVALARMKALQRHSSNRTIMEPHGIAAFDAVENAFFQGIVTRDEDKVIVLATAHPDKFPEALAKAGIQKQPTHPIIKNLNTDHPQNPESVVTSVRTAVEKIAEIAASAAERRGI